jgi:hypothetical protein
MHVRSPRLGDGLGHGFGDLETDRLAQERKVVKDDIEPMRGEKLVLSQARLNAVDLFDRLNCEGHGGVDLHKALGDWTGAFLELLAVIVKEGIVRDGNDVQQVGWLLLVQRFVETKRRVESIHNLLLNGCIVVLTHSVHDD